MKKKHFLVGVVFALCLIFAGSSYTADTAYAKGITKASQVKKLAKKQVKGAASIRVKKDREDGILVYQAKLLKGKKQYELVYRASDGKLVSQSWEISKAYVKKGNGKLIGLKKCKNLAKKQVPNGKITSAVKKRSKGIDFYDIKIKKGSKKYELKYHARTGKLVEYEWELTAASQKKKNVISEGQAKKAALKAAGGGTVVKVKLTSDDGVKVYEVDVISGNFEYEITIHAETGDILEIEKERIHPSGSGDGDGSGSSGITQAQAEEAALKAAGGGTVIKVKLDTDDGQKVYEVDILNGDYEYEVEVLASTGAILKTKKKAVTDADPGNQPDPGQQVSLAKAKEIAAADAGLAVADVTFTEAKLDREDGVLVYEIAFYTATYEYEYEINASTGGICSREQKKLKQTGNGDPGSTENPDYAISLEEAKSIAASHAGFSLSEVRFKEAEQDWEDGQLVYEITFIKDSMEYEYEIDAITGKILDYEWDLDD